jgi:hypothetical protein
MNKQRLSRFFCTLAIALGVGLTPLSAPADEATTREIVEQGLEELKARLALDDYQWAQVEMILKSGIRERVAITRRYGLDGDTVTADSLDDDQVKAMRKDLKECRKNTEKRMKRYLDKEQYKEFKAVQEALHEELLARAEAA